MANHAHVKEQGVVLVVHRRHKLLLLHEARTASAVHSGIDVACVIARNVFAIDDSRNMRVGNVAIAVLSNQCDPDLSVERKQYFPVKLSLLEHHKHRGESVLSITDPSKIQAKSQLQHTQYQHLQSKHRHRSQRKTCSSSD